VLTLLAWVVVQFALGGWRDPETGRGVGVTAGAAAGVALIAVVVFQRWGARADIQAASLLLLIVVSLALEAVQGRARRRGSVPVLAGGGAIALLGAGALWLAVRMLISMSSSSRVHRMPRKDLLYRSMRLR
jgi:hypothetical protein